MIDGDVKGVVTIGGKATTLDIHDNGTNMLPKEPVVVELENPVESNKDLTNDQHELTSKPVVQPANDVNQPIVPFPKRLTKEKDEENLKQLHINLPFIEALAQTPKYAKFMKVDLGASISLLPYTMYKKLGLGEPKATRMSLELADRSIQYPRGIIENVLIKVVKFILPIDSVILDMPEDSRVPIILGRPFLSTARAMIDVFNKKITLRVGDDEVVFHVDQSIKRPTAEDDECYGIDDLDEMINEEAQELLTNEELDSFLSRGLEKSIDQSDLEFTQGTSNGDNVKSEHLYSASANEIDEKKPELKSFPQHLEYAYLHGDKSFPIIISSELSEKKRKTHHVDSFKFQSLRRIKKRPLSPVLMGLSLTDECRLGYVMLLPLFKDA
ncbi:DNA-directed DNA polymerase [Tanacetum coccineum]